MRLGIRRKLIGTLMLVGLLPLALSLAVILGGGAAMRLGNIRNMYEGRAANAANRLADILAKEADELTLLARQGEVIAYARQQTAATAERLHVSTTAPAATQPDAEAAILDRDWPKLNPEDARVQPFLHNPLADRIRTFSYLDGHSRQVFATDAFGQVIAADVKPGDYFQADERWWQEAYNQGKGRVYVSSVTTNPATGNFVVEVVVPVYDTAEPRQLVGILKDKVDVAWFRTPLSELAHDVGATSQLFDRESGKTVLQDHSTTPAVQVRRAEEAYVRATVEQHHVNLWNAIMGDRVIGYSPVPIEDRLKGHLGEVELPHWVVIVSNTAQEAMMPVYRLTLTVAAIGIALILILFILGVAIANREIIMPILRLREATAAVGRGELNIRLMAEQSLTGRDPTFRDDELGQLARDFDEMTRELQKNLGQLARSNEAKRRFMELAGHELRTPVTYILGVCQLAQRQLQLPPPPLLRRPPRLPLPLPMASHRPPRRPRVWRRCRRR